MHWTSLPGELVEDILSRVPAIPLARLHETSKQWNAILKSGRFAKMHTANAPKEKSMIVTLIDYKVCLVKINLHASSVKVAVHKLYLKDPLSKSSQVRIRNVFHCEGLLLCTTKDKRVVVWNPYSGETKWVKLRDSYKTTDYYALGYDNKSSFKQYKILRVDREEIIPVNNKYEIYDFTCNSWRVLGASTDWFLAEHRRGISVKGNTYWIATQAGSPHDDFVLSFDFSTEMFQSLCLPHHFPYGISALSVVREEQLCLLGARRHCFNMAENLHSSDLQVWVKTSTGSWNKSLGVMTNYETNIYPFSKGTSFLADEQNKVVLCLNTNNILYVMRENKLILKEHLGGDSSVLLNYVPSLAQIQQGTLPGGRKRKAPST